MGKECIDHLGRDRHYGRVPAAFESTRSIYELLGVPDRFSLTMSLEAALNGRFDHDFSSDL